MDCLPDDVIYVITLQLIEEPSPRDLYNFLATNPTALALFRRYGSNLLLKKFDSIMGAIAANDFEFYSSFDCDNMFEWNGLLEQVRHWTLFALKFHHSNGTRFALGKVEESMRRKINFTLSRYKIRESVDANRMREVSRLSVTELERQKSEDGDVLFKRRFFGLSMLRNGKRRTWVGGKVKAAKRTRS